LLGHCIREEIQRYASSETDMWTISISSDGTILSAGFDNGNIILWDVESGAARHFNYRPYRGSFDVGLQP
jgi:WD40 repeat protein